MAFPRILVKAPNWIGDAVLATPFLTAVRAHWPRAHLAVLGRAKVRPVLERIPGIDERLDEPEELSALARLVRAGDWDLAFTLSSTLAAPLAFARARIPVRIGFAGGGRGWLLTDAVAPLPRSVHQVEHYLALGARAGMFRPKEPALAWTVTSADRAEADGLLTAAGIGRRDRVVVFAPGASFGPAKRWFTARWAQLGDRIMLAHGDRVVLVGGREEHALAARIAGMTARPAVNAAGALSLGGTAALLARSVGFVSNDSGLMHVGAAVGARTIGLFGSSLPAWTGPFSPRATALWGRVACSPCFRRTCLPGRGYACQAALGVDAVAAALG